VVHGSGSECMPSTHAKNTMNVSELKTMDPPPAVGAGRRPSP
jgi:hypothetical protein